MLKLRSGTNLNPSLHTKPKPKPNPKPNPKPLSISGVSTEPHNDPKDIADLAENQLAVINHAMKFPSAKANLEILKY